MLRHVLIISSVLCTGLSAGACCAQDSEGLSVLLEVFVDSDDPTVIKDRVESLLRQEITSLGDVYVLNDGELKLRVTLTRPEYLSGLYRISILSLFHTENGKWSMFKNAILVCGKRDLEAASAAIVAWYDTNTLQHLRNSTGS